MRRHLQPDRVSGALGRGGWEEAVRLPTAPSLSYTRPNIRLLRKALPFGSAIILALQPGSLWACAACYGQSDSPMAQGMNWGILSLLAVVVTVLGSVAAFFVYLARRSAAVAANPAMVPLPASTDASWSQNRSAPVLGRGDVRKRWGSAMFHPAARIGPCCGRGRAHSGMVAFRGSTRNAGAESISPIL